MWHSQRGDNQEGFDVSTICEVDQTTKVLDLPRDAELERRVTLFLSSCKLPQTGAIQIQARGGSVTLSGLIRARSDRRRCVECCRRVAGVVHVVDRLELVASNSPARTQPSRQF